MMLASYNLVGKMISVFAYKKGDIIIDEENS